MAYALSAGVPAFAGSDQQSDTERDIVVTGQVDQTPSEVRQQARQITAMHGPVYRMPLARFENKICPGVIGMRRELAEIIVDRIRRNAERVGLDTAKEDNCQPNIIVAFVENGQKAIKELKAKQGYLFKNISTAELKELASDPGPVHAWVNTILRSRQGDDLHGGDGNGYSGDSMNNPPVLYTANTHSHIFLSHRIDITNSIVVIDFLKTNGMSVVQLADYATMRAFARTKAIEGGSASSTILSLFDEDAATPLELTDFDLAYLRAVYGGIPNMPAITKIAHINNELEDVQAEKQQTVEGD